MRIISNYKKLILIPLFLVLSFGIRAQNKDISSKVVDAATGETLIGVTIKSKSNPQKGTITDVDGNFTINTDLTDILVFTYMGYNTMEVPVKNIGIQISMNEKDNELKEIIVVGYGVQTKASTVAAITQTTGEELLKTGGVTTVSQALQGMLPGVVAVMDNAKPGADAGEIFIRGKSSWNSTSPLILVDGIERNFNDVDPNEIETISVLKDASATAVYGVKGANGVILITTKRGSNEKPSINFTSNFGFKQPTTNPDFADYVTSLTYWNEALKNDNQWANLIPETTIDAWKNAYATGNYGPYNDYFPEVNWWDEAIKDVGYQQNYNINLRGGTDFVGYFVSLGYLNDGDIFETKKNSTYDPSFSYERYNWRSNFDFNLTKTTKFGVNLAGKLGHRNQAGYRIDGSGEDGYGQAAFFQWLYKAPRNQFPIKYSDDYYGVSNTGEGNIYANLNDIGQRMYKYYQGFFDFNLNQQLDFVTKGLSFKTTLSYTSSSDTQSRIQHYEGDQFGEANGIRYSREWDYSKPNADGSYPILNEKRWRSDDQQAVPPSAFYDIMLNGGYGKRLFYEFAFNYNRTFGDHNLTLLALMNRQKVEGLKSSSVSSLRFPGFEEAWVGRATYSLKSRYLAEVNAAYTGSEKFAPGKRYGFFPSFSAGWRISEEPFVKKIAEKTLSNLKLRYSYGIVGSDIGANSFNYIQTYTSGGNLILGTTSQNSYGPLIKEGAASDMNATWEKAYKQNLGIDLLLWNKLNFTVDLFKERRTDILMARWSPVWFGIKDASANIGKTKNQGVDFDLGWNDKIGNNIKYWVKGNISFNENRIVYKDDPRKRPDYQKNAGKPIGWQSGYHVVGNYQSLDDIYNYGTPSNTTLQGQLLPGDFMYADFNSDGVIDTKDVIPMDKVTYPLTTYGFSFGGSYKNFDISVLFYGAANMTRNLPADVLWDFNQGTYGIYTATPDVVNRWNPGSQGITRPTLHAAAGPFVYNRYSSNYTYRDYSYLRLKSLEISYHMPKKVLLPIGLKKMQIYTNGNNLITFTGLTKRIDPETKGADVYPMIKRYNIGFRIDF